MPLIINNQELTKDNLIIINNQPISKIYNGGELIHSRVMKSAKEWRDAGFTQDGIYKISPDGINEYDAYCDMTTDGGGWTLMSSQKNDFWFTSSEADLYTAEIASPNANKYSILQHVANISPSNEYRYVEHRSDSTTRWIHTIQDETLLTSQPLVGANNNRYNTVTGKMDGFKLLGYSHFPDTNYLNGFGITASNASAFAKYSSNIYNWVWAITILKQYTTTSPMIGGIWNDGEGYNKTRHIMFWAR